MGKSRRIPAAIRNHESGLTMIEVLAAMIVAAVGILALAPMMVVSIQGNGHADSLTTATMKAQTMLEMLKQQDPLPPVPYQNTIADTADSMTQYVAIDNHASDVAIPTGVNRLSTPANWVTETQLKQFYAADETARTNGTPLRFDGQLYTNNSIFSVVQSTSKAGGKMWINGSIVVADIGVLTPVELRVNYDSRLRGKLLVANNEQISLTRISWLAQGGGY